MPRRAFVEHLQRAQQGILPLGIHNLQAGEDDGQLQFAFTGSPEALLPTPVKVTAMVPDLSEYPKNHEYMIFCGDDAPLDIGTALQNIKGTHRKTVFELLDIVSATLVTLSPDKDGDLPMQDSQHDDEELEDDDEDVYDSDHEAFDMNTQNAASPHAQPSPSVKFRPIDRAFRNRVRSDLLAAKNAGFKVGHLGPLLDGFSSFVTVSIRMSKLGISEEAMQAWQVKPNEYLILIMQYPNGYRNKGELEGFDSNRLTSNISLRVCAGRRYKPTLQEAQKAFTTVKRNDRDSIVSTDLPSADEEDVDSLKDTFISKALNHMLNERFMPILRFRGLGMGWKGAEDWYTETMSRVNRQDDNVIPWSYFDDTELANHAPNIVNADHLTVNGVQDHSFPLLAMQFTLRHFVRCTDFCLVCHRRLDTELEAIKPYVCESPLCLYQYMTLGFGPSIEHEIQAQPYVVDLLISFAYSSANSRRLKEYPDGLALKVPPVDLATYNAPTTDYYYGRVQPTKLATEHEPSVFPQYEVGFDRDRLEIIFFQKPQNGCPVKRGSWIVLTVQGTLDTTELHCRVSEVDYYPTIKVDEPITYHAPAAAVSHQSAQSNGMVNKQKPARPSSTITPAVTPQWAGASFQVYEQDFDDLDPKAKCVSICKLLSLLPNVKALQEHVATNRLADLKNWVDGISPAGLSLLRWIIASNRACIMQVDGGAQGQDRLYGMKGYMQFRFAMGAPDKEQRFISEVRKTSDRLKLNYPTIFAWHGSPLHNWHMIIREGLHYKNADHGRAYGDGVYHAKDAMTSTGYAGGSGRGVTSAPTGTWPNSLLRIGSSMALNEIVNAPAEFQSSNPYYVVKQLDWIQTRYLFVQCSPVEDSLTVDTEVKPANAYAQDPSRTPQGISDTVVIPASAITSSRAAKDGKRRISDKGMGSAKKLKGSGGFADPINIDDDVESVATDAEDLDILFEEETSPTGKDSVFDFGSQTQLPVITKPKSKTASATDFEPGTLDFSKLPLMPLPSYAVSGTTKSLMRQLKDLQKVLDTSALPDLGWYIDTEKIENVYQWIVELHSFHVIDPKLPLVADMKKMKLKSIVLEIRFNKDFPFTPPYVRVIRPRFLTRMQGGGGHIVMGGAMCMELLTNTGWSSVSSMESVLMQIRLAIASDPPARIETRSGHEDYGTGEAAEGYLRACQTHGWAVPPGFREMAMGKPDDSMG